MKGLDADLLAQREAGKMWRWGPRLAVVSFAAFLALTCGAGEVRADSAASPWHGTVDVEMVHNGVLDGLWGPQDWTLRANQHYAAPRDLADPTDARESANYSDERTLVSPPPPGVCYDAHSLEIGSLNDFQTHVDVNVDANGNLNLFTVLPALTTFIPTTITVDKDGSYFDPNPPPGHFVSCKETVTEAAGESAGFLATSPETYNQNVSQIDASFSPKRGGGPSGVGCENDGISDHVQCSDVTVTVHLTRGPQPGRIIVEKQTDPIGAPDEFTFTGALVGNLRDGQQISKDVAAGTYTVTEQPATGWNLRSLTCSDSDSTGDLSAATATFRVAPGETVRCVYTNERRPEQLIVTGAYSYFGTLGAGQATATGTDSVGATGTAAALARVARVCVIETWKATDDLDAPTTLPQLWNGQAGPFEDGRVTLLKRGKPDKKGFLSKLYMEVVAYSDCRAGTSAVFGAFPQSALVITHTGAFVKLHHNLTVQVWLTDGRRLEVDVGSSNANPGTYDWAKTRTRVFRI